MKNVGLGDLRPAHGAVSARKRLGRGHGSGQGKTSGRGHKGTGARASRHVPPGFEGGQMPLIRRIPKRGFRNPSRVEVQTVAVGRLAAFDAGSVVDGAELRRTRLVRRRGPIKILADGEITRALTVRVQAVSARAREKIEAAGGTVEVVAS